MNAHGREPRIRRPGKGERRTASRFWRGAIAAVLAILVFAFVAGCGSTKKQSAAQGDSAALSENIVPIQVAVAEQRSLTLTKTYSGTIEGEEQASIVAKIPERITGIQVRVGEQARAGQVIVTLDKSGASSQFYQAEAGFKNAEKTLERMKSLYEEGAISLQALDETQTAYAVAKANFDAARNTVELSTPISGVVTAIYASMGDLAEPGAVLATVANVNRMKVTFDINEGEVAGVSAGQKILIHSDMRPDIEVEGRVVQLSKSADVRSRSFEIKAAFPNTADRWFKPGMFCKVDLPMSTGAATLVVPSIAVQSNETSSSVFVVQAGRSLRRAVRVGIADVDYSQVLDGLSAGDTVVTVGVNNVRDSSFVRVTGEAQASEAAR